MRIKKSCFALLFMGCMIAITGFFEVSQRAGIDFFDGSWRDALTKAKIENKPVFVYVYAKWCGQCKQLKKNAFRDREAGEYFNKNFINIAIDGETSDGSGIMRNYNVKSYPTLLIVDSDGKLLSKTTGNMKPYILKNFGRRIIP